MITARAIAINCGILKPNDDAIVMEGILLMNLAIKTKHIHDFHSGPEFRRQVIRPDGSINYSVFKNIAPKLRVMARCSPTDKYNLVKGLIKLGLTKMNYKSTISRCKHKMLQGRLLQ